MHTSKCSVYIDNAEVGGLLSLTDLKDEGSWLSLKAEQVVGVSCTLEGGHSALVCASGRVYTYGDNSSGQLGLGRDVGVELQTPSLVAALNTADTWVTEVACGSKHTLFCTADNKLYACGANESGQLGLGHNDNMASPQQVFLSGVKAVAAGSSHSVALTVAGRVYVWGSNESSQLGLGEACTGKKLPKWLIHMHGNVLQVACGLDFTALLTERHKVYLCGSNLYGQLGVASEEVQVDELQEAVVDAGLPIVAIACGGIHTVALTDRGQVFAWGDNSCHQLGIGDGTTFSVGYPIRVTSLRSHHITQVSCGWLHTVLLTGDGQLFTMGHGQHGQLCEEGQETATKMTSLDRYKVTKVACGSKHTLVLVEPRPHADKKEATVRDELPMSAALTKTNLSKSSWQLNDESEPPLPLTSSRPRRNSDPAARQRCDSSSTTTLSTFERRDNSSLFAHVQAVLECFVCLETMRPPIQQCVNGHNVCASCRTKLQHCPTCRGIYTDTRNYALEHLSEKMSPPSQPIRCEQCCILVNEDDEHCCLICPFQTVKCTWSGMINEFWQHLEEEHPDDALVGSLHSFIHTQFNGEVSLRMIGAWDEIFALYIKHDTLTESIQAVVQHIGRQEITANYMYKLEFFDDDHEESTLFRRKLTPMGDDIEQCFKSGKCICEPMRTVSYFVGELGLKCTVEIYDSSLKGLASFSEV